MPRFETVVDKALEERIVRMRADGLSAPKIWDVLSDEMDFVPSLGTIKRVVQRNETAIAERATRDLNVLPRQAVPEPRATVRQKQRASRRTTQAERAANRAAGIMDDTPSITGSLPGADPKAEPPADEQGYNARQKAGLPAMPAELTTEQYLRAQGRRMYKQGEAILDETGIHSAAGFTLQDAACEIYRRTGRFPQELCLAMAVAG